MRNVDIAAEVKRRVEEKCMTADECLIRLAEHARGSMAEFLHVGTDGEPYLDLRTAKEADKLHLIKSFTEAGEKTGARLELYDAQSALEKIGKAHGLFNDKTEHSGEVVFKVVYEDRDRDSVIKDAN